MSNIESQIITRYQDMINKVCTDHDCLNQKQRKKLGLLLSDWHEHGIIGNYIAVIDFLFATEEIDLATKLDLEDLA